MSTLAGGSCAVLLFLAGHQHLKAWALTGSFAITVFAWLIGARRVWVALQRDGYNDAWFREAVNLKQGWVIEVAPTGQGHWRGFWTSPWIIGALAVNVVALLRVQGWSDLQLALLAGPAVSATTAWIAWAIGGPMLARALYLRELERQLGITFVHPQLDEIQALRSRWFFTRWLMPKRPS